ncbi:MAG: uracil-DNA glycosylase [Acidobacteria bacterium]|nr:uracil-DNA glycosylase [Acidobacteriota bacterium]
MDVRDNLIEHLRFFGELGAQGVSRDEGWTSRADVPQRGGDAPAHDAGAAAPVIVDLEAGASGALLAEPPAAGETLEAVRAALGDCTRCKLHRAGRRQIVFGVGNPKAELMFVGEGPGHDEDVQGIPFVGKAGQLLTKIIEAIHLTRDQVYIANVIKCRPPENRNPEPDEVASCEPFLLRQVEAIRPKVIVALGTFAARTLLKTQEPISHLRGRVYRYGSALVLPTFHPAFLLRSPERKRDVWEDMKKVRALLAGSTDEQDR